MNVSKILIQILRVTIKQKAMYNNNYVQESIPREEGFQLALASLQVCGENDSLKQGITAAKKSLEAVARMSQSTLASRGLMLAGPFNYFIVQEVCYSQRLLM